MFMSSIRRWRSGLIAAVRMVSSIGRLLSVERSRIVPPTPDYAQSKRRGSSRPSTPSSETATLPRSGFVLRPVRAHPCRSGNAVRFCEADIGGDIPPLLFAEIFIELEICRLENRWRTLGSLRPDTSPRSHAPRHLAHL